MVYRIVFALLITSNASAAFTYPSKAVLSFGSENVESDLIRLREEELTQAEIKTKKLKGSKKEAAISAIFKASNDALIKRLRTMPSEKGISSAEAQAVLDLIRQHPIVSETGSRKYDTKMGQIGYCFGQAAFAHLELLRRGADPKSIAKLFAIGPLMHSGRGWDFHVTTLVRARDNGWWAIDGLNTKVLSLEEWSKKVLSWAQDRKSPTIRFYFSDAVKLNPTPGAYNEKNLFEPHYRGFFKDLAIWFDSNPVKPEDRISPAK
jgi:hypothetical protein